MAGYIGSKSSVTQVDGYNRTEADDRYVNASGDTMTGALQTPYVNIRNTADTDNWLLYHYTDGSLRINRNGAGSDELQIDTAGRVTMPYQPAFVAVSNIGQTAYTGGTPIVMNIAAVNIGGHYNTGTGYFTAPIAGMYAFKFTMYSYANAQFQAMKNGAAYIEAGSADVLLTTIGAAEINGLAWSMYLQAGDYVGFGPRANYNPSVYRPHGQFSGYLIG